MKSIKSLNRFDIVYFSLALLFALILLPRNLKSIGILLFGISVILLNFNRKKYFNTRFFILNVIFFFGIICTLLYTTNYDYAIRKLQTMSSLLVFPFLFSLFNLEDRQKILKQKYFFLAIYILSVFLFNSVVFSWFYLTHYSFSDLVYHFHRVVLVDIGKFGIHPIYLSMHCCLAILFSAFIFKTIQKKNLKIILVFINLVLMFFLIIYARKGPLLAIIITSLLWVLFENKKNAKLKIISIISLSLLLFLIPKTRNRFSEIFTINKSKSIESNSYGVRFVIYKNASELIKESPFFGYGIGDYNDKLKESYKNNNPSLEVYYNSHNQYISFFLVGGSFLLLLYFIFLYFNVKLAIKKRNAHSLIILCFYSIVMLSENILERENGVIFFSFFLCFFSLNNYNKDEQ
tara:strand:+ start:1190 stop:2401 length:1212 start_codon:yes stop_codon:yes gene_type:complete